MAANGDANLGTSLSHPNSAYFPYPFSSDPLPHRLSSGLVAPGLLGLLSVLSTTALLSFIGYRFVFWRKHYRTYIGYNQYVVLIINLLVADLQQAMSFLISFYWINQNAILAPSRACFAQGWLLNIGDVASGLFVFFIAFHTFYCAVKGRRLSYRAFAALVVFTWLFSLILTAIGPILYRERYFVRAGAWCWASANYEQERLALHYIWVFMVQFGTIIIYVLVLLHLKRAMSVLLPTAAQSATYAKIDRAAKLMILYPIVYIVLTLPLSAGRMWSMAHNGANLPDAYSCVAGALIAASGFVDALLYTLTRRQLISGSSPETDSPSPAPGAKKDSLGWFKRSGVSSSYVGTPAGTAQTQSLSQPFDGGITQTRTVTIVGRRASAKSPATEQIELSSRSGRDRINRSASRTRGHSPTGSMDPIMHSAAFDAYAGGRSPDQLPIFDGTKRNKALISVNPIEVPSAESDEGAESDLESMGSVEKDGLKNMMFRR